MKNLILTLVFAITSLVSFSQSTLFAIGNNDTLTINNFFSNSNFTNANNGYSNNIFYVADTTTKIILKQLYNSNDAIINKVWFGSTYDSYGNPIDSLHNTSVYVDTLNITDFIDTIYVKVYGNLGNTWFKIIKINSSQLGVNDLELTTTRLSAYPNPASSNITIDFDVTTNEVPVAIFSMSGQLVYSNDDNRNNGTNSLNVDVSSFQTGIYIVKAGSQTFKFVKQ